ncbi:MAG: methyltransferase domain-containing protein [Lachnospiraceae bacterium]|nr:methyltransferase domain-containing protein [Lachnospiraceae bacterium]
MEAYTDFASVYDIFMDDTPYEEWCVFLDAALARYKVKEDTADAMLLQEQNSVLDLGCGTGTLTELLAAKGYDMIGIDNSQEMLQIAMEKRERSGLDILYLQQDMREFELYGAVGAVISVCDSLNYLLTEEELLSAFRLVRNYLYPGGVFIFDFNTVYKYAEVIGDATIAENREECSFIWENYYHPEEEINEYDLTIFVKNDSKGKNSREENSKVESGEEENSFRRFQETHYQRGYRLEQMKALLRQAGLDFREAVDADTNGEVTAQSERIIVISRKSKEMGG